MADSRQCDAHQGAHSQIHEEIGELKEGQRSIKSTLGAVQLDILELKNGMWGINHMNGVTGKVASLSGSFKIIIILLVFLVGSTVSSAVYSAKQSQKYFTALQLHNEEPAHAVMEARYITVIDSIDKLVMATETLHNALDYHIIEVREQNLDLEGDEE